MLLFLHENGLQSQVHIRVARPSDLDDIQRLFAAGMLQYVPQSRNDLLMYECSNPIPK